MINKKDLLITGGIVLGAIIIIAGILLAMNMFTFKLATVDIQKIEEQSSLSKKLNEEVQVKGKELSAKFKMAKTEQEKQAINTEYDKFKNEKQKEFTSKIKSAIEKVAKKQGYKAVSSSQVYIYSAHEITQAVIKEMEK